ncbi:MAG: DPP IV N-terminal domain-containing protein [Ignavibacterium sp.]|nr:MAG: DPP IV N-terminal domain-containing protein [Ignavibacterium sp.]
MKSYKYLQIIFILILLILSADGIIFAQNKNLTFSQVYQFSEPRILQRLPVMKGWLDDNHFLQMKIENESNYLMKVNAESGKEDIYIDYSAINKNLPEGFNATRTIDETEDSKGFLFNKENDLYYYSTENENYKRLTESEARENNPTFSPDGKKVSFTRERNLFAVDVETGEETQLTFDGSDAVYNGWASWVYWEEILGRGTRNKAYWWAPNSKMIAFLWFDDSPVPKFPLYNSDGVRGEIIWQRFPKAGDPNPNVKMGIAHIEENKIIWVEEDENIDQYTAWPFWTKDSNELFYQVLNRGQDSLTFFAANPETGKNRVAYNEVQETWVEFYENIYLFENGSGFILRSDKDGWRHLYYYDMNGDIISRITAGKWVAERIVYVDEEAEVVFFEGWRDNSFNRHLYRVNLDGKELTKITKKDGRHESNISPGASYFYCNYSSINQPTKLELHNINGEFIRTISERKTVLYDDYLFGKTELFKIKIQDGTELPAKWVLPKDFDPTKKYPVILAIYGGPGFEDVKNSYFHFLDRYFIAQSGIIYFQVDHRGSSHFGKKGTSLMHRNLGKIEIMDYIEAVEWLREQPFVDETKIGIEGSSYGGYMALMGLTYGSDYFTHGYAEAPGTDWKLYDNVYTERYMDKPDENPDGYEFGSVMTHAEKLKGELLIVHGTTDDNAHFQQTLQLVDVLTDLDKDFELMIYPNEGHGWWMPKWSHSQRSKINFWYRHFFGEEFVVE